MKKLISVIAPMYNEEQVVIKYTEITLNVLRQLKSKYDYEILFVHDGAKDNTLQKMTEMQDLYPEEIGIVNLSRNFGLEGAINAGLKSAKGDAVIVMDADLQDPPSLILEMVNKWENGNDVVIASRVLRTKDSFFKRTTANIFYKILDSLSGKLKLEKSAANFRLMSRRVVDKLIEFPEVNTYFRVIVPFIGMKTDTVEYDRDERVAGQTNYNFASLVRCALDGLTSISIEPLRKIMYAVPIAILFILASFISMIFTNGLLFIASLMILIISIFFLILFLALFVMSEYIAQIMLETRHRPTSIIYEYKPSKMAGNR